MRARSFTRWLARSRIEFEYDPVKSASNKAKHGIDFEEIKALWDDESRLEIDAHYDGEQRSIVIGTMDGRHWSVIVTYREGRVCIISARRSRKSEVILYEQGDID